MKKIFTLIFSLAVLSIAAMAQQGNYRDNGDYTRRYQSSGNGYYANNNGDRYHDRWNNRSDEYRRDGYRRRFEPEVRREVIVENQGCYEPHFYQPRKRAFFEIVFGRHRRF